MTTDDQPWDDNLIGKYGKMSERAPRQAPQLIVSNQTYLPANKLEALRRAKVLRNPTSAPTLMRLLVKAGHLPLSGEIRLDHFSDGEVEKLASELDQIVSWYRVSPDPENILSVGPSLSRILRLHPELRDSLFHYESKLLAMTKSSQFEEYIEGRFDEGHAKRLKRLALEFNHLHLVGKLAFDKNCSERPDWEAALGLDLPNEAIDLLNIEMMQLCARGDSELVRELYERTGKGLAEAYKNYNGRRIAAYLGRQENAAMNVMTCVGNMYTSVANAHMMRAAQESGYDKSNSIKWARKFMEDAEEAYGSVKPTWGHGHAGLYLIRYVEHNLVGNTERAESYRQLGHDQLIRCNDIRKSNALNSVRKDDLQSLKALLITNF